MGPFATARRERPRRHRRAAALLIASIAALALILPGAAGAEVIYPPHASPAVRTTNGFELRGTVYQYGGPSANTKWHFEFGPTTEYGTSLPLPEGEETAIAMSVSAEVTGLMPDTVYHWRLVSTNSVEGMAATADQTFSTAVTTTPTTPTGGGGGGGATGGETGSGLYPGPSPGGSTTMPSVGGSGPKKVVKTLRHGKQTLLTTTGGRTLYALSAEKKGKFICTVASGCTEIWKPLTVASGVTPQGPSPLKLGTIHRPEGTVQVTYQGHPLYTFAADKKPGQVKGEGLKDVGTWHAVFVPAGNPSR
jgi:predicted lipoprotein with Yx(FWY)xxD motif